MKIKKFITNIFIYVWGVCILVAPALVMAQKSYIDIKELENRASKQKDVAAQMQLGKLYYDGTEVGVDYKKAEKWLKKAAENGESEAKYLLGIIYIEEKQGKNDGKKGIQYLNESAVAGNVEAKAYLANLYITGLMVEKNTAKGIELYKQSAKGGNLSSQRFLAEAYDKGELVDPNKKESLYWKEMAAENGAGEYNFELGNSYLDGLDLQPDIKKAIDFFLKAEKDGDEESTEKLIDLFLNRPEVMNVAEAVSRLEKTAGRNHPEHYLTLGEIYLNGKGNVEPNYNEAFKYYHLAQEYNYKEALPMLGLMYFYGMGTTANPTKAVNVFAKMPDDAVCNYSYLLCQDLNVEGIIKKAVEEADYNEVFYKIYNGGLKSIENSLSNLEKITKEAAQSGSIFAKYSLGNLNRFAKFWHTEGEREEMAKLAHKCYKEASEKDLLQATDFLGDCYFYGIGCERDRKEAVKYYATAAESGLPRANNNLGNCYLSGWGVEEDMEKAVALYKKAAESFLPTALCNLGECYESGLGVPENPSKAFSYYTQAAEYNSAEGYTSLGDCYLNGISVKENFDEAVKYYEKAASLGSATALIRLGDCYLGGFGVSKSVNNAIDYYEKAVKLGDENGWLELGNLYYNGEYVGKDYSKAAEYFFKAAENDNEEAQNAIAECYEDGDGVEQSLTEAKKWYEIAAENGSEDAKRSLARLKRPTLELTLFRNLMDDGYRSIDAGEKALNAALEPLGFSFQEKRKEMMQVEDCEGEYLYDAEIYVLEYTNGRNDIEFSFRDWGISGYQIFDVKIFYSNEMQADAFIADNKSRLRHKLEKSGNDYIYNFNEYYYGITLSQDGSQINMRLHYDD